MIKKQTKKFANALHLKDGDDHLFALANIQVYISEAQDGFFAQAMQVDYFACGETLEDVQNRFTKGLIATREGHLHRFGTIKNFLKWAPDDVRAEIRERMDSEQYDYTMINTCHVEQADHPINIQYYREEPKRLQA